MSRATETQHHGDEFVARNTWLHLLLGLESYGRRFDALLDAYAPRGAPVASGAPGARDAELIDFVLGLASLRATLRRLLREAAQRSGADAPRARSTSRADPSEWLR